MPSALDAPSLRESRFDLHPVAFFGRRFDTNEELQRYLDDHFFEQKYTLEERPPPAEISHGKREVR